MCFEPVLDERHIFTVRSRGKPGTQVPDAQDEGCVDFFRLKGNVQFADALGMRFRDADGDQKHHGGVEPSKPGGWELEHLHGGEDTILCVLRRDSRP